MDLNAAQSEAVHTLSGPLLVLAGAGTGKTRVVTYRIAELIRHRTPPDRILAVTFTNKAAAEMQQRAAGPAGQAAEAEAGDLHLPFALRADPPPPHHPSRLSGRLCHLRPRRPGGRRPRRCCGRSRRPRRLLRPGDLLYLISRWKTARSGPEQAAALAQTDKEHLAAAAYRRYQKALKAAGAVDFDDLLLLTEELFPRFPRSAQAEAGRFDHLLVDEYQDTNGSQYRIVKALAGGHRNLCVVGDDDQSIYGWRGAEVTHILALQAGLARGQGRPAGRQLPLDPRDRRLGQPADRLQPLRHAKVLRATVRRASRRGSCNSKTRRRRPRPWSRRSPRGIPAPRRQPRDFAILFRTNEQPRAFETELRRAKIPYVLVGGMSFYDRKEVRDMLAYLKVLAIPRDEVSLLRIINTPPRGIGQAAVKRLLEQAIARASRSGRCWPRGRALAGAWSKFRDLVGQFRQRLAKGPLAEVVRDLIAEIGYREELARLYPDADEQESRWQAVEEVVNAVAGYAQRAKAADAGRLLAGHRPDRQRAGSRQGIATRTATRWP